VDENDDSTLWNSSEEEENVRNECKMKTLTVKRDRVTLIAKGR
jgi:hypothetical protein